MIWLKMLGFVLVAYVLRAAFRSSRAISLPTLDARLEPLTILPRGAVDADRVRLGGAATLARALTVAGARR